MISGVLLEVFVICLIAVIAVLSIAKVILFISHKTEDYHLMYLLYFPSVTIMYTSDSREKRHKKLQNRLTGIIVFLAFVVMVFWFLLVRPALELGHL